MTQTTVVISIVLALSVGGVVASSLGLREAYGADQPLTIAYFISLLLCLITAILLLLGVLNNCL